MSDALRESYRYCDELSRASARNFYYAFRLLPPERRRAMCALYAFMRQTDDLADEPGEVGRKRMMLDRWRGELNEALDGHPGEWPGWLALADTAQRRGVPRVYLHEVIDGVSMDVEPGVFATFGELYRYCHHVASAVGLSCLHIWGFRSEGGRAERLAEACGVALQLTNIVRDVREDAAQGRIYLPREDLQRFGVDDEALRAPGMSGRLRELLVFECERARTYYEQSRPLVELVDPVGRPVLRAIVGIYRALLDEIVRRDYDVWSGRVRLPAWRKTAITLRALVR